MRTTLDLPEKILSEVLKVSQKKTKRAAVVNALEEYLRNQRKRKLLESSGAYPSFKLNIRKMRKNRDLS